MTATTISPSHRATHTFTTNDLATKREVAGAYLGGRLPQLMLGSTTSIPRPQRAAGEIGS